ncbi:atherin-like [Zalophus californianus]|uniref:Atherin-like n=1 Tax=Zalophus californianus TaxID=9704 RepID=A0A6J2DTT1_ZALCA|nr:atherin-like [Zalophus californianus]
MASPQQPHSESSCREEPPWGGSTRLCERKEKRETRKREPRAELASPAAAYAPTAPPRLRRRRRPPRGPPPETRWRQFRCPGSPDVQASPLRPKPCGRDVGAGAAGAKDAGEVSGSGGRAWAELAARAAGGPYHGLLQGRACRRQLGGAGLLAPPQRGAVPAGGDVAEGGVAYLGRSLPGAWPVCGAGPRPAAE